MYKMHIRSVVELGLDRLFEVVQRIGILDNCIDLTIPLTSNWSGITSKTWSPISGRWVLVG